MKRYLGVDLHRTQLTVCTRLENGRTYLRQWPMRELKLFAAQLRKDDEIAVETTGNTRLFYDAVVERVTHVAVVNPNQPANPRLIRTTLPEAFLSLSVFPPRRCPARMGWMATGLDLWAIRPPTTDHRVSEELH